MRRLLSFLVFAAIVASYYFYIYDPNDSKIIFDYTDEFETFNREFWYIGEWKSSKSMINEVDIKDGILTLKVNETDKGPYLLSKPIEIEDDYVIKFKRRVKIKYANDKFTGGLTMFQTDSALLHPDYSKEWENSFGEAGVLVEYVHNYNEDSTRPGRHIFRVLPPTWEVIDSARLIKPIFDEWFEEELIYDTRMNRITYIINGKEYNSGGLKIDKDYIRFFTHSYGWGVGHEMMIDWINIKIIDESIEKRGKNE
ncbi:MAG: hypothetical protein U9N10_01015 [Bacillota bacterium]|nr:hypothetical protein [Bacillota bacterium]